MSHKKIKSLTVIELENIIADAINSKLNVNYKVKISNLEYIKEGSIDVFEKEITNLTLSLVNKLSDNIEYNNTDF